MLSFLIRRVVRVLLTLVSVELLVFLLIHVIPGSPWDTPSNQNDARRAVANSYVTDSTMARLNKYYGLELPLWRQFTRYFIGDVHEQDGFICGVICGNL